MPDAPCPPVDILAIASRRYHFAENVLRDMGCLNYGSSATVAAQQARAVANIAAIDLGRVHDLVRELTLAEAANAP